MNRNLAYAAVNLILFAIFLWLTVPIWVLFLALTAYYGYQAFQKPSASPLVSPKFPDNVPLGQLGSYTVDGDEAFGLFVRLGDHHIFIDIRKDALIESRKRRALDLYASAAVLQSNLSAFQSIQKEFADRRISYIGLHAPDVLQGEVFWEPTGYTILRGLSFVSN